MTAIDLLTRSGGVFAVLTLVHFIADWGFQSHSTAMAKHNDVWVRAGHCLVYTLPFLLLFWLLGVPILIIPGLANLLFWSHFLEDTYLPVYWWAKYVRKPTSTRLKAGVYAVNVNNVDPKTLSYTASMAYSGEAVEAVEDARDVWAFKLWMATPLGAILGITIDQVIHLVFLYLVAFIVACYP